MSESENFTNKNSMKNGKFHTNFTLLGRGADISAPEFEISHPDRATLISPLKTEEATLRKEPPLKKRP